MVSDFSVGKIATVVNPPIQMASSAMKKWAQFLESIATRSPGWRPRLRRWAAIRRASSTTWRQVESMVRPPPTGWVR